MEIISFTTRGSFRRTDGFLKFVSSQKIFSQLEGFAKEGIAALASATPVRTGLAANSWGYEIQKGFGNYTISWTNTDIENGFPVVIALQYGHGTGTGGYVQGVDFINPAIRPIFDKIADKVWKAVTSA